ncbi:MAG: hypothetical protein DRO15_07100, partial [Thermoprotei archaeon]
NYIEYMRTTHKINFSEQYLHKLINNPAIPDIILIPKTGYELTFNPSRKHIIRHAQRKLGTHYSIKAISGIFMAWGPHISSLSHDIKVSVFDIAPSILSLLGITGGIFRGHVRKDIFEVGAIKADIKEFTRKYIYLRSQIMKRMLRTM